MVGDPIGTVAVDSEQPFRIGRGRLFWYSDVHRQWQTSIRSVRRMLPLIACCGIELAIRPIDLGWVRFYSGVRVFDSFFGLGDL
jgi:hypothetical protein